MLQYRKDMIIMAKSPKKSPSLSNINANIANNKIPAIEPLDYVQLRGPEGLLRNLSGLREKLSENTPYAEFILFGLRF